MLYDAIVKIKLPGNNPADAAERLKARVPHWPFEIVEIDEAASQPPPLTGSGVITMPIVGVTNGR